MTSTPPVAVPVITTTDAHTRNKSLSPEDAFIHPGRISRPATENSFKTPGFSHRETGMTGISNLTQSSKDKLQLGNGYLQGPITSTEHSKLPYFLRIRGSVTPGMIVPILVVACWTTAIVCVSLLAGNHKLLRISPQLITVLGFLVGLSLSFRSSTAYERYNEGRKYWTSLGLHAKNFSRIVWINAKTREGEDGEEDVLAKLTAVNLCLAFAHAVKHKLRYEPDYDYEDMQDLIRNLDTFAKSAHNTVPQRSTKIKSPLKRLAADLGITFAESNPQKRIDLYRRHGTFHGNLPLEIMNYLSAYIDQIIDNKTLATPAYHTLLNNALLGMMDALSGCERILETPLPIAYNIVISQVTWIYVMTLPFQLVSSLKWITIPATVVAAYMIIGLAAIGREIENPFGTDVNDLNLDLYCETLAIELDTIVCKKPPVRSDFITTDDNLVLQPLSTDGFNAWKRRGLGRVHEALYYKPGYRLDPATAREVRHEQMEQRDAKIEQEVKIEEERRSLDVKNHARQERFMQVHGADASDAA